MRIAVVLPTLLALASAAVAQPPARGVQAVANDRVEVSFEAGGMSFEDLVRAWARVSGHRFHFRETEMRGKPKIQIEGTTTLDRAEADWFFQSLLVANGAALVPIGPPAADLWSIEFVQSSISLRQLARFVPPTELDGVARRPAEVFVTSFQLQHVEGPKIFPLLSTILTNRSVELVQIGSPKSVVVTAFGPTLAMIGEVVRATDRPENVDLSCKEEREKKELERR